MTILKNKIKAYSNQIGIDLIGFTKAEMNIELTKRLELQAKLDFISPYQKRSIKEKTDPKLLMPEAKTIIAIALAYPHTCLELDQLSPATAYFSSCSWGLDYHFVLREKLEQLANFIRKDRPHLKYKIAVDTSPLCDRTIAYQAGLGFFGKNNLLINPQYGSYIFLGSLITNLDLPVDKPIADECLNCNLCIMACPTGALNETGILNAKRCLSYLTQKKGVLTKEEQALMTNCIYGCDLCQRVCPYNKNNSDWHQEFQPSGVEFVSIKEYSSLSSKKFKEKYGHLAGSWVGAQTINRNLYICKEKLDKDY